MLKEYQPLSQEKEYRKEKPCNNKESSFRANVNVRVYCIHPNNQIQTREAGSKAREQKRYYSIKPASSVLHDKGEVTERMRSNRGFEEAENGIRIASISDTGEARYYLTDQVDSVKIVVDKDGSTLNKFEYYPYGETWITEGEGNNNPKYNSQELDRETSFYFYNARHYDPEICRFVTADSVIDGEFSASGWNRYMYVDGNPIGYKDPTGHKMDFTFEYFLLNKEGEKIKDKSGNFITKIFDDTDFMTERIKFLRSMNNDDMNKVLDDAENSDTNVVIQIGKTSFSNYLGETIEHDGKSLKLINKLESQRGDNFKTDNIYKNPKMLKASFKKNTLESVIGHELGHAYNYNVLSHYEYTDHEDGYYDEAGEEILPIRIDKIITNIQGKTNYKLEKDTFSLPSEQANYRKTLLSKDGHKYPKAEGKWKNFINNYNLDPDND